MEWITTVQGLITLISTGVLLLSSIITLAVNLWKKVKELTQDKNWLKIMSIADAAMIEAEKLNVAGAEKKTVALSAIEAGCKEADIVCDLTKVGDYIDECISFANSVAKKIKKVTKK